MGQVFPFDQSDFLDAHTTIPELAAFEGGACLGFSQLWLQYQGRNPTLVHKKKFLQHVQVKQNQEKVVEWMESQNTILASITYDHKYKNVPIANTNTVQGRTNFKNAYADRSKELREWAVQKEVNLNLVDDIIRFENVIPYSRPYKTDTAIKKLIEDEEDLSLIYSPQEIARLDKYTRSVASLIQQDLFALKRKNLRGLLSVTYILDGHACGFITHANKISIFDPNFGEFEMNDKNELIRFIYDNIIENENPVVSWWTVGFKIRT